MFVNFLIKENWLFRFPQVPRIAAQTILPVLMVTPVHSFHFENLKAMHLLLTIVTPMVHYGEAARQN